MNGKILSILNDTHVLLHFEEMLHPEEVVEVIGEIVLPNESKSDELKELQKVTYPKGKLIIISSQGNSVFLATTSRMKTEKKIIHKNSLSLGGSLSSLFGPTEEVITEVPMNYPPKLDSSENLNLKISKVIKVGDSVRRSY